MKITFPLLDKIFFGSLRMHLNRTLPAAYFREQLSEMKTERLFVQRSRSCKPIDLVSPRAQWYLKMTEKDINALSNIFFERIKDEKDDMHKTYLVFNALSNTLLPAFNALCDYSIVLKKYPAKAEKQLNHAEQERMHAEENQILTFMKGSLAALYLDIQEQADLAATSLVSISEEQIYSYHFLEEPPVESLIIKAETITPALPKNQSSETFVPYKGDVVQNNKLKISYKMILKADEFYELEKQLFAYGLLDKYGQFAPNKAKSHSALMSAVYKKIIMAGFFRKKLPGNPSEVSENDIRKYLDHRYGVKLDQQFRKTTRKEIEKASLKLPFLEHHSMFR